MADELTEEEQEARAKECLVQCLESALRALKSPTTRVKDVVYQANQDYEYMLDSYVPKGGMKITMSFEMWPLRMPPALAMDLSPKKEST